MRLASFQFGLVRPIRDHPPPPRGLGLAYYGSRVFGNQPIRLQIEIYSRRMDFRFGLVMSRRRQASRGSRPSTAVFVPNPKLKLLDQCREALRFWHNTHVMKKPGLGVRSPLDGLK